MNTAGWVQRNPLKHDHWDAFSWQGKGALIQHIELAVFVKGKGPGVIIVHELPGMSRACLRLAQEIVDAGFRVYLPLLFGAPGKTHTIGYSIRLFCLKKEFQACAKNQSGVMTDWLNELSQQVKSDCGHDGVGVIGMCLTGNFALAMMKDDKHVVQAPVLSQPSLPIYLPGVPGAMARKRATGLDAATIRAVVAWANQERQKNPDFYIPVFQFAEDTLSPVERLAGFKEQMEACYFEPPQGAGLESVLTISKTARKEAKIPFSQTHSVLTGYFEGDDSYPRPNPTAKARELVIQYLRQQLVDLT